MSSIMPCVLELNYSTNSLLQLLDTNTELYCTTVGVEALYFLSYTWYSVG